MLIMQRSRPLSVLKDFTLAVVAVRNSMASLVTVSAALVLSSARIVGVPDSLVILWGLLNAGLDRGSGPWFFTTKS
jgi:hypothetical protein